MEKLLTRAEGAYFIAIAKWRITVFIKTDFFNCVGLISTYFIQPFSRLQLQRPLSALVKNPASTVSFIFLVKLGPARRCLEIIHGEYAGGERGE